MRQITPKGQRRAYLHWLWQKVFDGRNAELVEACFNSLQKRYTDAARHYHDFDHIYQTVKALDKFEGLTINKRALVIAIFFHDAIYDPTRSDNEHQSARLAEYWLSRLGEQEDFRDMVHRLIMATRHLGDLSNSDEQLIADLDLIPLSLSPDDFDKAGEQIRQEYRHVPESEFKKGRKDVLKMFLKRKTIYYHMQTRLVCEKMARKNLQRTILRLDNELRAFSKDDSIKRA